MNMSKSYSNFIQTLRPKILGVTAWMVAFVLNFPKKKKQNYLWNINKGS